MFLVLEDVKLDVGVEESLGTLKPAFVKAAHVSISHAGPFGLR